MLGLYCKCFSFRSSFSLGQASIDGKECSQWVQTCADSTNNTFYWDNQTPVRIIYQDAVQFGTVAFKALYLYYCDFVKILLIFVSLIIDYSTFSSGEPAASLFQIPAFCSN